MVLDPSPPPLKCGLEIDRVGTSLPVYCEEINYYHTKLPTHAPTRTPTHSSYPHTHLYTHSFTHTTYTHTLLRTHHLHTHLCTLPHSHTYTHPHTHTAYIHSYTHTSTLTLPRHTPTHILPHTYHPHTHLFTQYHTTTLTLPTRYLTIFYRNTVWCTLYSSAIAGSCPTYQWVMSHNVYTHTGIFHILAMPILRNAAAVCCSVLQESYVRHATLPISRYAIRPTYQWVMSHISMSHVHVCAPAGIC